jgi:uncharacterized membrane protein YwzB
MLGDKCLVSPAIAVCIRYWSLIGGSLGFEEFLHKPSSSAASVCLLIKTGVLVTHFEILVKIFICPQLLRLSPVSWQCLNFDGGYSIWPISQGSRKDFADDFTYRWKEFI